MHDRPVAIFGAGIAGPMMALQLADAGYDVQLVEKRVQTGNAEAGRTIHLALPRVCLEMLEPFDLRSAAEAASAPLIGRLFHARDGRTTLQSYDDAPQASALIAQTGVRSIPRARLNALLTEAAAAHPRVELRYGSTLHALDASDASQPVRFEVDTASGVEAGEALFLVGADGARSSVRDALVQQGQVQAQVLRHRIGYRQLHLPVADNPQLRKDTFHLWPRAGHLLIALPDASGSFGCVWFMLREGEHGFAALGSMAALHEHLETSFADVQGLADANAVDLFGTQPHGLRRVECSPWWSGNVVLVGDACQAQLPFGGQGVKTAFDDCRSLRKHLEQHAPDWTRAFAAYEAERQPQGQKVAAFSASLAPFLISVLPENGFPTRSA